MLTASGGFARACGASPGGRPPGPPGALPRDPGPSGTGPAVGPG